MKEKEFKKYPNYKLTGIEWIDGDASTSSPQGIPEEWEIKKIKHLCYVKGRVGWKGLKASEFLIKGFAYLVTGTDFKGGLVDWKNCYQIDEERYLEDPYIQLRNDDLLITKDGTIGKLAIVENLDKPACLNSGIFVVRSLIDNFSTRYLYWILRSTIFSNYNNYTSYGSTIQHLYQNVFVEFNFCFPMSAEQTDIANYLDNKTAKIDTLIEKKKKLIELLKEERTAIINQAVTRGINPNVKLKDSGIEWLGQIPEHWEVKKLKYVAKLRDELIDKSDFKIAVENIESGSGKLVGMEEHKNYQGKLSAFRNGDTIFNKLRPYLHKVYYAEQDGGLFGELLIIYSFGEIIPKFLFYKLFSKIFIDIVDGSTQGTKMPRANWSDFISLLPISFPKDKDEQVQIVQHIETDMKRIDGTISKIEREIELLAEYRTALINEVVTGKVKVI